MDGEFRDTLEEIEKTQRAHPGTPCYLQPYSLGRIKFLAKSDPTPENPITLYLSLTDSLESISYRAKIVGWQDKRELKKDQAALAQLNQHIKDFQPGETDGIYLENAKGKPYVNLISVIDVRRLENPRAVSRLIKTSDGKPRKRYPRPGGWSEVREQPEWFGMHTEAVSDHVEAELQVEVARSLAGGAAARLERLATAPKLPERIQVVSLAFRRNADVIVEVSKRADGKCEECHAPAPFLRRSDGSPYLEVHHRKMLSDGGEDTVANALALCPNCHRKLHFGMHSV
jgi:predicted HNH restriction endonuclease